MNNVKELNIEWVCPKPLTFTPSSWWDDPQDDGDGNHFYPLYQNKHYVSSMSMDRCSVSGEIDNDER